MRYSRIKKSQSKKRYAKLLLVVLLGFVILYLAFAGTLGKFVSKLISPIFNGEDQNKVPGNKLDDQELTLPDKTSDPVSDAEKITDSLKAEALVMYTIQMGAFNNSENAHAYAKELKSLGGAAYILHDNFYRVLAIGFQSEEDAKKVRKDLKANGMESHVYKLATAGADMKIIATQYNVDAIKSAYEIWEEKYLSLEKLVFQLDSGAVSSNDAYDIINAMKSDMEDKRDLLAELNTNNMILSGLVTLYDRACESFDKILSLNSSDKLAISAEIKYTYIEMLMQYKEYMESITR
ncbi:MAG: SPOR domain-containing protein [Clostridia bacterium]|nr:SPOR domain-containing protein [Clostridia bacterium]